MRPNLKVELLPTNQEATGAQLTHDQESGSSDNVTLTFSFFYFKSFFHSNQFVSF